MIYGGLPYLQGLKCVPALLLIEDGLFRPQELGDRGNRSELFETDLIRSEIPLQIGYNLLLVHRNGAPGSTALVLAKLSDLDESISRCLVHTVPFFHSSMYSTPTFYIVQDIISYRTTTPSLLPLPPEKKRPHPQTGNSVFLLLIPNRSTNTPIYGPITGKFLTNPAIVPKKSPKRTKIP